MQSEVRNLFSSLKNSIVFSIVRFIHNILNQFMSVSEIVFLCTVSYCFLHVIEVKFKESIEQKYLLLLLNSQAIIEMTSPDSMRKQVTTMSKAKLILDVTVILIIIQCVVLLLDPNLTLMSRIITLLRYMYADSIESITQDFPIRYIRTLIAGLILFIVHRFISQFSQSIWINVARSLQIVSVNLLFADVLNDNEWSVNVTVGNVLKLFLICKVIVYVNIYTRSLDSVSSFAVWKAANLISNCLSQQGVPDANVVTVSILCLAVLFSINFKIRLVTHQDEPVLTQLICLVCINAVLSIFQDNIQSFPNSQGVVLLLFYLALMNTFAYVIETV